MSILYYFCFVKDKEISSKYIKNHDIIIKKYPNRVVLKVIFISVCHRENEVFYKSFASLLGKQVRVWEQCSQGFNRIVLFYLRMLFTPVNFHLRKFDKELYLMWMQLCHYLESNVLTVLNACLTTSHYKNVLTFYIRYAILQKLKKILP